MSASMIQIDPKLINELVREHIQVAVAQALSDKKDVLVNQLVHAVLSTKVDEKGTVQSQEYYNKHTWLDYMIGTELREAVKKTIIETIRGMQPEIEKAVRRDVAKSGSSLAKAMMSGFEDSLKYDWTFKVQIGSNEAK